MTGEHEIERINCKRINNQGEPEYELVWKGFGPEHNRWYQMDMLQNAKDLVDEFEADLKQTDVHYTSQQRSETQG